MASFSSSIQKAQILTVCHYCEASCIKWKCINCDWFMCQTCIPKYHSNIPLFKKTHEVVTLSDYGSVETNEVIRKVDLTKLDCTVHSREVCVNYCKDCDRPLCSDCLIEHVKDHKDHDFCKLEQFYNEKLKDIKEMKTKLESDIPHFTEKEETLQQMLAEGNKQYSENRQKITEIKDKTLETKDNIVKYAETLLSQQDKQWKPTEDQLRKEITSVRNRKNGLKKRINQLDQKLRSQSALEITGNSLDKSMPDKTVKHIEIKERKFIPGKLSNKPISVLFGSVYEIPVFQLVQSYQTNLDDCSKFIKCNDKSAYIGSFGNKLLQKVTLEKDRIKFEREVKLPVYDMTLMTDGDLLISSMQQDLKLHTKDGKIKICKTFAPLYTLGVHVNKQNEIFVELSDSVDLLKPIEDSVRKVEQINKKGVILHTYEYGTDNQRLFTWPARIYTNNEHIYVIDLFYDGLGRVVVIDKGGQLQWSYNGGFDEFKPNDIAVTSSMVIVTNCTNHSLHLLSLTGEVIVCKVVTELGNIVSPKSISSDEEDNLWIGTWQGPSEIHSLKLK